jgi:hypothetical protein
VRVAEGPATAALALCAPRDRFQVRREEYTRAIRSPENGGRPADVSRQRTFLAAGDLSA